MEQNEQSFVRIFGELADLLNIPDETTSRAKPLASELASYACSLFRKGPTLNIFFSDHGISHSANMLVIFSEYLRKFNCNHGTIPLESEERLPFLMLVYSSVLLHDIYMSVMQDGDWDLTLKKINVEQLHRDDHVIKTVIFLLREFYEKKFPSDLWISFWNGLKGFKYVEDNNTFLLLLRICKSHGDGGFGWLSDDALRELRIGEYELKNLTDEKYRQKLTDLANGSEKCAGVLKSILGDGIDLTENYYDSQDSVMRILRSASGFLCLLDLLDINNRFNIFNDRKEDMIKVLKDGMEKNKLKAFKQHWLADRLVKADAHSISKSGDIRWEIIVEQVGGQEFADAVKAFCGNCGATSSAYRYGNDPRLLNVLKDWKYGGIDIKVQKSFSDDNIEKIYRDIFNFEFGNASARDILSDIWNMVGVREEKDICDGYLSYIMLNSESLFEISKQDELMPGLLFVSPFMQAIRKGVPLDLFVEFKENERVGLGHRENGSNAYFVHADSYYVSFLGGLKLAREIFTRQIDKGKVKWVRKTNRVYNALAERGDDKKDRNVYLVYCPNKDIVNRITEIASRRSNAVFVLFGLSESTDGIDETTGLSAVFPQEKIAPLCEKLKRLAGYIFEKDFEKESENELAAIEYQSPDELLQGIMFVVSGAAGDADRIVGGFLGKSIGPYLLAVIISIYAKTEDSGSGETVAKVQKSLAQRCFDELTKFVFYQKQSPLDSIDDCNFTQALDYFVNILNVDDEYLVLKDGVDMTAIIRNIKKQIDGDREKKYLMRIVELHTILWARDFSRLNVRSVFLEDFGYSLMCALPIKSIVTFVLDNKLPVKDVSFDGEWMCPDEKYVARLRSRNEIVCAALHAIWFMDTLASDREFFINETEYIELLINELLQKCDDLVYDYDIIVFQALYRMIESLMNFSMGNHDGNDEIEKLIFELREKFVCGKQANSLIYCLADLEAMCSYRQESLIEKIKENVQIIINASNGGTAFRNIYQFAFDIIYHYGKYADSHIDKIWESCSGLFPKADRDAFTAVSQGIREEEENRYSDCPFYRLKRVFNLVHESFSTGLPTRMKKRISKREN